MATVTVILGLSGAGKSHYLHSMQTVEKFEEGVRPDLPHLQEEWKRFMDTLASGKDCAIIEIAYITQTARDTLATLVHDAYRETTLRWVYFENNLEAANWNCLNDPKRTKEEALGNIENNQRWTNSYEIPEGVEVIKIFRLPALNR